MIAKKCFKNGLKQAFLRCVFAIIMIVTGFGVLAGGMITDNPVYAEPDITTPTVINPNDNNTNNTDTNNTTTDNDTNATTTTTNNTATTTNNNDGGSDDCQDSLGAIGWLVCPTTGKIAEAVDWLYDKIENILVINPIESKDGSPIYEIWKYCRGITNIVFIIFLLVVIYSQITGVGISNYGLKKALPKLIVAAVLVNLSFLICQLGVDLSNVVGSSLRGVFTAVQESAIASMEISPEAAESMNLAYSQLYGVLAGGSVLAIGAALISFETGAIWMLIPIVLGAIVAVASGLITIALRQAVVALLVMIAPLAIVANILPNTEKWFKKWKDLLIQMLIFYPMFSLLFGASSLAGFAIIASAKDAFWLILGLAVQVFPLFFSWSLMKMSGTVLGTINTKMRGLASRPLAGTRSWADSRRQATKAKHLASGRTRPSLALMQYMSNRRIAREEEANENMTTAKNRGLAYRASRNYKSDGSASREGMKAYRQQAENLRYAEVIERDKNNMNKGLGQLAAQPKSAAMRARLQQLDVENVTASDRLKIEKARGEIIEYDNAVGFHKRMEDAVNAHFDSIHRNDVDDKGKSIYTIHDDIKDRNAAEQRYGMAKEIMEGSLRDTQYAAASAARAYDTQQKIHDATMGKYIDLTPPTRDVEYRIGELTRLSRHELDRGRRAVDNIDPIVSGLRVLNQRGDTDLVKEQLDNILDKNIGGGLILGTHASQAIASFLMFDVKDNDPYLRRFGKYINLETARVYNKNDRKVKEITYDEYVKGYHDGEPDLISETNPTGRMYAKKDMVKLMEGTSLDGIERTALDSYDNSLKKVYTDENGVLDLEAYKAKRAEVDKATAPQFISANMKYLSGSEQIGSAVKSKTGFFAKQNSETGEYTMTPIWEDEKELNKLLGGYDTPEEKEAAKNNLEKWYRNQTLQYLRDQTPAQILGLRSDYKDPLIAHLSKAYLLDDDDNEIPERKREHDAMVNRIDTSDFGLTDQNKIIQKRKEAKKALQMTEAGEAFRELLFKKGKLAQIEKSKRSGAANNAKDWVREMLLLDTDNGLKTWILRRGFDSGAGALGSNAINIDEVRQRAATKSEQDRRAREEKENRRRQMMEMIEELKAQQKHEADPVITPDPTSISAYDAETVAMFSDQVEELWYDVRDGGSGDEYGEFFDKSYNFVVENLTESSYVAMAYKKYYEEHPDGDSYDLREYLIDLLKTLLEG